MEKTLGQLRVTFGEIFIDLDGVLKLYGRLRVLALLKVLLAALKILLFLHFGVPGTSDSQSENDSKDSSQSEFETPSHHDEAPQRLNTQLHYQGGEILKGTWRVCKVLKINGLCQTGIAVLRYVANEL